MFEWQAAYMLIRGICRQWQLESKHRKIAQAPDAERGATWTKMSLSGRTTGHESTRCNSSNADLC